MNMNIELRDEIIFGGYESYEYENGCRAFKDLTFEKLNELWDNDFVDSNADRLSTIRRYTRFMEQHPEYVACGTAFENTRKDYRIVIERLGKKTGEVTEQEIKDFRAICGDDWTFELDAMTDDEIKERYLTIK